MSKRFSFGVYLLFAIGCAFSYQSFAQKDTIFLAPATVRGTAPERFMSGLKYQKIDSVTLTQFRFQNLADILAYNTSLAFKNYGPGALTTVSFRGTSANHTAVLWNGLNINSPTLGQSDFSTIPVAGFDQLAVQYGSAASIVGTDAVGGSVLLNSTAPTQGFSAAIGRQQESFHNSQTQAWAKYGSALGKNWAISGKTAIYYGNMKNRFPEPTRRNVLLLPTQTIQKGIVQDVFLRSKNNHELSAHVWLTDNALTINPENAAGRELTQTQAYRTMLKYQWNDFSVRASWVRDIIDYATGDYSNLDHAVTDKLGTRIERDFHWNVGAAGKIQIKSGGEFTHFRTRVAGYERPEITENRGDLFLLTRWETTSGLLVSANLRQAFVTGFQPPFTPSLGVEYPLIQTNRYTLKAKGSLARSYRVPTLNERYWKTLGNPDIKPESGFNKELGIDQQYTTSDNQLFSFSATVYHNRIKNWSYWNPGNSFKVENLQEVLARGIELQAGWNASFRMIKTGARMNYTYTRSSQEKIYDAYAVDIVGKQLTYIPKHSGNVNLFTAYRNFRLTGQLLAVSRRYTRTDNSLYLDSYVLANLLAETNYNLGNMQLRIQGQVNNIGNSFYLNVRSNAMPGRSFAINLLLSYRSYTEADKKLK
ncbi:TonB-dependent receptor plug domain-containing protein [Dyadobacter luteus]|uniref:TonB-dependent receptor plug domain-containing protein n=1 Tax=Dyadobacter luteus TaxID=2259619 RepID=UPI001E31C19D|nr:TonB-dependent receptor plug domain-containing protein [Dyadobacter luteus]